MHFEDRTTVRVVPYGAGRHQGSLLLCEPESGERFREQKAALGCLLVAEQLLPSRFHDTYTTLCFKRFASIMLAKSAKLIPPVYFSYFVPAVFVQCYMFETIL